MFQRYATLVFGFVTATIVALIGPAMTCLVWGQLQSFDLSRLMCLGYVHCIGFACGWIMISAIISYTNNEYPKRAP